MNRICKCGCEFELLDYHHKERAHPLLFTLEERFDLCHRCFGHLAQEVKRWLHDANTGTTPTPIIQITNRKNAIIAFPTVEALKENSSE